MTYAEYVKVVLHNGLGDYALAAEAEHNASTVNELVISPWALYAPAHMMRRAATRMCSRISRLCS